MVEGITVGKTVKKEDWYIWMPKGSSIFIHTKKEIRYWEDPPGNIYSRINRITLSAGDRLWQIAKHWIVGDLDSATPAT